MNNYSIFLLAVDPILNPEKIRVFEKISRDYSVYLNTILYLNWIEILSSIKENFDFYLILHESDKDFIPKNFIPESAKLILLKKKKDLSLLKKFKDLKSGTKIRSIFIFYNSIGIRNDEIIKTFDLLSIDDQAIVIGKSEKDNIVFLGTNSGDKKILQNLFDGKSTYDKVLNNLSKEDIFIQTIDNFLSVNNFQDLKKLYGELSRKESLSFCSEYMHERFNDLFVEYKELLNE